MTPVAERLQAWQRLAQDLDVALLESLVRDIELDEAIGVAAELLEGRIRGRVVVRVSAA